MEKINVDVAVIGSGSAGLNAYKAAKKQRKNVVMIEGGKYGTTCARVGCMPSKLMIAAAETAHVIQEAPKFGIDPKVPPVIDGIRVMERVRKERDYFVGTVMKSVNAIPQKNLIQGKAKFLDKHTLQIDDHTLVETKSTVIATGSYSAVLPFLQPLEERLLINDDVFEWNDLPSSIAVFGVGVIGLELGQSFHRLGIRTRIFGIEGLVGPITDPELLKYAQGIFQEELAVDPYSRVQGVEKKDDCVEIRFLDQNDVEQTETFEYVLAATGRLPNVKNLGLENLNLTLDNLGVPDFDPLTLQCGDLPIFIAGDANNKLPLLHEASDEGRIAGKNAALFPDITPGNRRTPLMIAFCDPQIAIAGKSYAELTPDTFVKGMVSFENQGRSMVMLKNKGQLHVYADKENGYLLGAEMVGPRAEHIGHLLAWAIQQKLTVSEILEMPFYHPVIEEGLRTALRNILI